MGDVAEYLTDRMSDDWAWGVSALRMVLWPMRRKIDPQQGNPWKTSVVAAWRIKTAPWALMGHGAPGYEPRRAAVRARLDPMGKNTDVNRAAGSIYSTAMHAGQALAVTLTDAPPIQALPTWPLSLRALVWCKAVLASAETASPDLAEPGRTALRGAIDGWRALLGKYGRMPSSTGYELKNFYAAVPTGRDAPDWTSTLLPRSPPMP